MESPMMHVSQASSNEQQCSRHFTCSSQAFCVSFDVITGRCCRVMALAKAPESVNVTAATLVMCVTSAVKATTLFRHMRMQMCVHASVSNFSHQNLIDL